MPRVSVLMSIYRPREDYLAAQLDSIDAQECADMEVVVYNDCPEDPDWEDFCRTHVTRHELRYVPGERNRGYVKAFEHLVGLAQGDYVVLCDQDDVWLPGRVAAGAAALDAGAMLAVCDRQVIDGEGRVVVPSWRAAHPGDASLTWETGEDITARSAFTCYAIGMATMLRTDVAQRLVPFSTHTGHDKWLALGASALGPCANLPEAYVQYRQHGKNQTGALAGVSSKKDWYQARTLDSADVVADFASRFPDHPALPEMQAFAEARVRRDIPGIWRHRVLAPDVARFEIALALCPDPLFRATLALWRRAAGGSPPLRARRSIPRV